MVPDVNLSPKVWRKLGPMLLSTKRMRRIALAFALAAPNLARPQDLGPSVVLKPGEAIVVPVAISEGSLTLGKPRVGRPGAAEPKDGEIAVAVLKHGLSPYAELTATEKTGTPVDFVATGLIGDIKIDEIRVCGRIDAPIKGRIASGSWRVSLNRFAVHKQGEECR